MWISGIEMPNSGTRFSNLKYIVDLKCRLLIETLLSLDCLDCIVVNMTILAVNNNLHDFVLIPNNVGNNIIQKINAVMRLIDWIESNVTHATRYDKHDQWKTENYGPVWIQFESSSFVMNVQVHH